MNSIPKKSAMRRSARNPARMHNPAEPIDRRGRQAATRDAVSSIVPAAVTQERSNCGERKKTSTG
jgi:hypothetical protein